MFYGTPYMGSKNFIAKKIVATLPKAKTLVEPFAGGCAITHCAITQGKYENYVLNDISPAPELFVNALKGKYRNECRWISREDFYALKDIDPYVRYCWSFGNNGQNYLYNPKIEGLRKIQWELCFATTPHKVRTLMRSFFKHIYNMGLLLCRADYSKGEKDSPNLEERIQELLKGKTLKDQFSLCSLQCLQSMQALQRLQSLEMPQGIENLEVHRGDYKDLAIPKDSIIYCDPPYKNKCGYGIKFNHEAFYKWCLKQQSPVFISEYSMPDEFVVIDEWEKQVNYHSDNKKRKRALERLYCPRGQKAMIRHHLYAAPATNQKLW